MELYLALALFLISIGFIYIAHLRNECENIQRRLDKTCEIANKKSHIIEEYRGLYEAEKRHNITLNELFEVNNNDKYIIEILDNALNIELNKELTAIGCSVDMYRKSHIIKEYTIPKE